MDSPSRHPTRRTRALRAMLAVCGVILVAAAVHRLVPDAGVAASDSMLRAMRLLAGRELPATPPPHAPENPRTKREHLLAAGFALLGTPYEWGAKGPDAYDCSGFTRAAYAAIDVSLPDGSFNQAEGEQPLEDPARLVAGDLLFYRWAGKIGVSHVTMYAGDGWVLGTGSPGQRKQVVLYPLSDDLVDDGRVITYRHITLEDE